MAAAGESHDLVTSHVHRAVRQVQNHVRDIEAGVGNYVAKKEEASHILRQASARLDRFIAGAGSDAAQGGELHSLQTLLDEMLRAVSAINAGNKPSTLALQFTAPRQKAGTL